MSSIFDFLSKYQWNYWSIIALLCLLAAYSLLLVKEKKACLWLRNWVLLPATAVGGFVIYFIGYLEGGSEHSLLTLCIRSFISTFHMFLLHSDLIEVRDDMHADETYMIAFSLIHLMAFLLTFMVLFQLFGKHLLSWLRLKLSAPAESHVFFGLNEASLALAKDLMRTRKRPFIVFLDKQTETQHKKGSPSSTAPSAFRAREPLFEQASKTDALLLHKEYTGDTNLRSTGIAHLLRGRHVYFYFLSPNAAYNLQSAAKLHKELAADKNFKGKAEIYVKTENDYMAALFAPQRDRRTDVHLINAAKLAALELVLSHPPVDYVTPDTARAVARKDFNLLIVGFGTVGRYALRYLTEMGQFVGSRFHATLVDKEGATWGDFACRFPGMRHYDIEFCQMECGTDGFWALMENRIESLDYIVVSLGDSELNMRTAINLSRYARRKRSTPVSLFVKVHDDQEYEYMQTAAQAFPGIEVFGSYSRIFTEKIIVNEARSCTAKRIHDFYNNQKEPARQTAWNDLSPMQRITNMSAAMHIATKLKLAGLTVEEVKRMPSEAAFWQALGTTRQENLAQGEHLHWNATLFANEWDTWTPVPVEATENKDNQRKLHACLVGWDDLEWVEQRFGTSFREYDRDSVRKIYELIKKGTYPAEE